jgi:hypothetical protein
VLFGHLLRGLDGRVTIAAGRDKSELLVGAGVAAAALDFDTLPMHEVFTDTPLGECSLPDRLGTHERLISCFAEGDRGAELRLAAACGAGDAAFLPTRPPEGFDGHLLDLWGDLLGMPDLQDTARSGTWDVPDSWRDAASGALRALGVEAPCVLVHPGSGGEEKCWAVENFLTLADELDNVVFVVGPVEMDRWPAERMEQLRAVAPVWVCPELTSLAGAAAKASAFVGNDSGVAHLAAAVGAPTVAIFGPTNPTHFAPVGPSVRVVAGESLADVTVGQVREGLRGIEQDRPEQKRRQQG